MQILCYYTIRKGRDDLEFKDLIKLRRSELHLTLEDIGNAVGVSKATVLRWESGEIKNLRRDKIAKLAKVLKVSPAYLMGWEDAVSDEGTDLGLVALKLMQSERISSDAALKKAEQIVDFFEAAQADLDKQQLINNYDKLNLIGKQKLIAYSDDLVGNPANTEPFELVHTASAK